MIGIGSKRNYSQRCVVIFHNANRALRMELGDIIAKHADDGLLQSGVTIRRSIDAFERHTGGGVDALQNEFASLVQSRGREWTRAMRAIDVAISGQLRSARDLLDRPFRLANGLPGEPVPKETSISHIIDDEIQSVGERLYAIHAAYSEGWTAPLGKPWHERHPILYAAIAAVCGSLVTAAIGIFAG